MIFHPHTLDLNLTSYQIFHSTVLELGFGSEDYYYHNVDNYNDCLVPNLLVNDLSLCTESGPTNPGSKPKYFKSSGRLQIKSTN